jgi:DNA-binding NarL/FixJ family response regulator
MGALADPMMPETIHVAIVDDFPLILQGYEQNLASAPHIKIIGTALRGDELMPLLEKDHVDLLILDIKVPISKENKRVYPIFHVIPQVLNNYPNISVVVATMFSDPSLIKAVVATGVSGYILKDDLYVVKELGSIITSIVRHNGRYWSPDVLRVLERDQQRKAEKSPRLTPQQLQAISLCDSYPEKSTAELAALMHITGNTFRNHLTDAYLRLGVNKRGAAVIKARELGLIVSDDPPPPSLGDLRGDNGNHDDDE